MKLKQLIFLLSVIVFFPLAASAQVQTFTNPLLPSGADPWCIYKDGFYYYTNTLGNRIDIWRTKNIATLATAERKTVWRPPAKGPYSREIWAPEIHFLKDKWYIYFAADSGRNEDHRLWVLENSSLDPMQGEWIMKGKLTTPGDRWSIDGSVFEYKNAMYLIWSGWEAGVNGQQNIYIAKMTNPWTVENKRLAVSTPTYGWEKNGSFSNGASPVYVNEGPQTLEHNNDLFLIYSASGCWTDYYALGMIKATGENLMDSLSWKKYPDPVFSQAPKNKVFAPGHNSFFKSPDGSEDWILYHANNAPALGCGRYRSPRAQKFSWSSDGIPYFGDPVAEQIPLVIPSEKSTPLKTADIPSFRNPVLDKDFPDPMVIKAPDGKYYAYATQGNANGKSNNIQVAISTDMVHWKPQADALPAKPSWAKRDFWAPHVLYDGKLKKYVMFYSGESVDTTLGKCLGVAFSDKPGGPFVDKGSPLLCGPGFEAIDPMAMIDPKSGKKLLYWGSGFQPVRVQEMENDWKSFRKNSAATAVVWPGKETNYTNLIEGSWVDYFDGHYFLYYSGDNCCGDKANYAVMVARSDSPFGPFQRLGETNGTGSSIILEKDADWIAPGHNSIFRDAKGKTWIAYHAIWRNKEKAGPPRGADHYLKRVMCIKPVVYKNHWPVVVTE